MLLLFKSIYAEGNTEPRKRKNIFNPPPARVDTKDVTLPLSHYAIDT